jgi:hypothetical protein
MNVDNLLDSDFVHSMAGITQGVLGYYLFFSFSGLALRLGEVGPMFSVGLWGWGGN